MVEVEQSAQPFSPPGSGQPRRYLAAVQAAGCPAIAGYFGAEWGRSLTSGFFE
jgi:hypothetical protein